MKRLIGIVIAVALALVLMSVLLNSVHARPAFETVTLVNPGFDSNLNGWTPSANCAWSDTYGQNTVGSVIVSSSVCYIYQFVNSPHSGIYTVEVYIRNESETVGTFVVELADDTYGYNSEEYCAPAAWSGMWCQVTGYLSGGNVGIAINLIGQSGTVQWADDFSLEYEEVSLPATPTPSFYTCTLSYGHLFDFGLMLLGQDKYVGWNLGVNAPARLNGLLYTLILDSSAGYSDLEMFINGELLNHTYNNSASTVITQTACYWIAPPYGATGQCAMFGTFDYVRGTNNPNLVGGPGPVTMQFLGGAHLGYGPSSSYVRATLRNMYVVYYGIPGPSCNTTPPAIPPTAMPTPTRTPGPTGTPPAPTPTLMPTAGVMDIKNPLKEIQDAVDAFSSVDSNITRIITTTDIRTNPDVITVGGWSPFVFFRGMIILLEEFEWLTILAGWFAVAMLIIVAVTGLRLLISFWGIIERILQLLDLIPFT